MVKEAMLKVLEGFHNQSERMIVGKTAQRMTRRDWEWLPVADTLDTKRFWPVKEYIQHMQAIIAA